VWLAIVLCQLVQKMYSESERDLPHRKTKKEQERMGKEKRRNRVKVVGNLEIIPSLNFKQSVCLSVCLSACLSVCLLQL
jgi:hypothetical protein